ncbi:MAG: hypothetical protein ABIZ04_23105 [Opitutus sp.]
MQKFTTATLVFIALTLAGVGAAERRILVIPLDVQEQTLSDGMRQQLALLESEGAYGELPTWTSLAELPSWVFVEKKREIAYVFSRPGASDEYRYAVIWGGRKKLIIVRAGGIAGSYEIFLKPKTLPRSTPSRSTVPPSEKTPLTDEK